MASLKRLLYIFIPVLAFFLMSHNANALDYSINSVVLGFNHNPSYYLNNGSWSFGGTGVKHITPPNVIEGMQIAKTNTGVTSDLKRGDVLTFNGYYVSPVLSTDVTFPVQSGGVISSLYSSLNCQIFDLTFTSNQEYLIYDTTSYLRKTNFEFSCNVISDNPSFLYINLSINANLINVSGNYIDFYISNVIATRVGSNENQEQAQATQDAADDSQDAGNSSSSDAETATSSLISVIGGFVNVLTSAQPTNCKINANLNHIDMGQLDLCANPVPSYIQIIGSIILICAAIPLAIVLFNRFIGLFRSFQG